VTNIDDDYGYYLTELKFSKRNSVFALKSLFRVMCSVMRDYH